MKSVLSRNLNAITEFPKLMESNNNTGFVVLFEKYGEGVVVSRGKENWHSIGHMSKSWSMGNFVDYHGSVTISSRD